MLPVCAGPVIWAWVCHPRSPKGAQFFAKDVEVAPVGDKWARLYGLKGRHGTEGGPTTRRGPLAIPGLSLGSRHTCHESYLSMAVRRPAGRGRV